MPFPRLNGQKNTPKSRTFQSTHTAERRAKEMMLVLIDQYRQQSNIVRVTPARCRYLKMYTRLSLMYVCKRHIVVAHPPLSFQDSRTVYMSHHTMRSPLSRDGEGGKLCNVNSRKASIYCKSKSKSLQEEKAVRRILCTGRMNMT